MKAPVRRNISPSTQLSAFIKKFEPKTAALIRKCRSELRKILPGAIELVYDNYNFFVIGYAATERASDCIVSIAAAANGVVLSFYNGASLSDPAGLLLGSGKQNRFIRIPDSSILRKAAVVQLIRAAKARTPLRDSRGCRTIIKSISTKQRPRRRQGYLHIC